MKLSTQSQHAIMAMLALAAHDEGAVRLTDLAEQQGISLSYLEQIFAKLRQEGLVEGIRGPGGGYRLSRTADAINLAEIASVVEDESTPTRHSLRSSMGMERQLVQQMWADLSQRFYGFLSDITLESLLDGHQLPRKVYRMGETASLIAHMFPARIPAPGMAHQAAM
jgi:Rrf2 family iron-sulfur cluster assembly transcriptional regulator